VFLITKGETGQGGDPKVPGRGSEKEPRWKQWENRSGIWANARMKGPPKKQGDQRKRGGRERRLVENATERKQGMRGEHYKQEIAPAQPIRDGGQELTKSKGKLVEEQG